MYILLITFIFKIASTELIVDTISGPIRSVSSLSNDVEAFLGVPYAEPPIEDFRFAKPVPKKHWTEIYNASNFPPPCTQLSVGPHYFMPDVTNMSEDCLYLNIWMPKSEYTHGLRPVIIYIHPGAFVTGSSNMRAHDGSHLASHGDVVVVTINYRLGVFGYFVAFTEAADGNMGMYDQIMAIEWVKNNAKFFGGDPENIVLMGSSAGAFSISAHMISPLSKHLFKRAIIQSGSIVHPYFNDDNVRLFRNSQLVASTVGCTNETVTLQSDPRSVVQCLKSKPRDALVEAEKNLLKSNPIIFYPRINDKFLPKSSIDLLREGRFNKDIEVIIGFTADEGTVMLTLGTPEYFGHYGRNIVSTISKHGAVSLIRAAIMLTGQPRPSELVDFYMNTVKNRTSIGYTKMLANMVGDFVISCNTLFLADILSLKGNLVYFYKFEFRAASTPTAEWVGTTHLDDVQYVFGSPYHENFTAEEVELSHSIIDRWAAFARTGNPNIPDHVPWLRYSYHNPLYLSFGQEEESIRMKPLDRCSIWRKRYKAEIDSDLIRFLRNSGMNTTATNVSR